ncbi:MAG: DUF3795 domain-containing protein [bacterium]
MTNNEEKMIACCGLVCSDCPGYIATKAGDAAKIAAIAELWAKEYNANISPDDVWCDGCIVEGRKCGHCGECEIRACSISKELANCGLCAELDACEKIQNFFKLAPHAKNVIDEIANCSR